MNQSWSLHQINLATAEQKIQTEERNLIRMQTETKAHTDKGSTS